MYRLRWAWAWLWTVFILFVVKKPAPRQLRWRFCLQWGTVSRHEIFLVIKWRGFALCRLEGVLRLVSLLTLYNIICRFIRVGFVIFLLYYYRVPCSCWLSLCFRSFITCTAASYILTWYISMHNKSSALRTLCSCVWLFYFRTSFRKSQQFIIRPTCLILCGTEFHVEMNGTYAMT